MPCAACGASLSAGASFCAQCGRRVEGAPVVAIPAPGPQQVETRVVAAESSGAAWIFAIVGLVLGVALAPFLFALPWRSLMSLDDGATLVGDAAIGMLVGAAVAAGGVFALRGADERGAVAAGVTAAIMGALFALALAGEATRLSRAQIVNGSVADNELIVVSVLFVSFLALAGTGIAMIPPGDRRERLVMVVGALGVMAGVALALACGWTLLNAETLQEAARARERRSVPGAGLVAVLATVAAAALAERVRRR